jgi:hypothetical protein
MNRRPDAVTAAPSRPLAAPGPPAPPARRGPLTVLVDFWARPLPAAPLALFRIALGSVLLLSCLSNLLPRLSVYAGSDPLLPQEALVHEGYDWPRRTGRVCLLTGAVGPEWLQTRVDGLLGKDGVRAWLEWGARPANVYRMFGLWLLALALMTVGFWTRTATVAAWLLTMTFNTRFAWLNNGGDSVSRAGVFYLMFAQAGAAWSLDAFFRRRRLRRAGLAEGPVLVPAWPVRLLQIQLAMIYFFTGLAKVVSGWPDTNAGTFTDKLLGHDWFNGSAVYWVLNDISLNRVPYHVLPLPLPLCRLLSWGTLIFELGFPLLVLFRGTRFWLLLGGVAFHLGIWVHTEVGFFSPVSLCWYALFLSGPAAEAILGWPGRLLRRLGQAPAEAATPQAVAR